MNGRKGTAKKRRIGTGGLLAFLFVLLFCLSAPAAPASQSVNVENGFPDGNVRMDFSYGYENFAETGNSLPVTVNVGNGTEGLLSGVLELSVSAPDGTEYRYRRSVAIPAGEEHAFDELVSVPEGKNSVYIRYTEKTEIFS